MLRFSSRTYPRRHRSGMDSCTLSFFLFVFAENGLRADQIYTLGYRLDHFLTRGGGGSDGRWNSELSKLWRPFPLPHHCLSQLSRGKNNTFPAYLASPGPDFLSSLVASLNSGNRNVHVLTDGSEQLRCFVLLCTGVFVFFFPLRDRRTTRESERIDNDEWIDQCEEGAISGSLTSSRR